MVAHGDYCDYNSCEYIIKMQDLTSDVQQLVDFADNTPGTGGGGNGGEVCFSLPTTSLYWHWITRKCF